MSGLSLAGLTHKDVTLVDLPIEESVILAAGEPSLHGLRRRHPYFAEVQALVRGEADAIFVKGAEGIVVANLIGAQVVADFGSHPDPKVRINNGTPRTLTVDAALADQRPDLVVRLLAVVQRASHWAEQHPEDTLRFVAREIATTEEAVLASNGPEVHRHLGLSLRHPGGCHRPFQRLLARMGLLARRLCTGPLGGPTPAGPVAQPGRRAAAGRVTPVPPTPRPRR